MDKNFFFTNLDETKAERETAIIKEYSNKYEKQFYVIDNPLMKKNEEYQYKDAFIILTTGHKVIFINYGDNPKEFEYYFEDVLEDIGIISDTYSYKSKLGRPREWKEKYVSKHNVEQEFNEEFLIKILQENILCDPKDRRNVDLLVSLFTGSINDIERVGEGVPSDDLEIIKKKIIQFDTTQTNFIYSDLPKNEIVIQGLSGTGKTELLLHKLRELYVNDSDSKIAFTCHNKILADKLKKRIPEFFDFMKVDEQIKWNERLWCFNAWGSRYSTDSGLYALLSKIYSIKFYTFRESTSFDLNCKEAIKEIENIDGFEPFFDYILIDESQDFTKSFFELCKLVAKNKVYIAGDIFQNVFREVMNDEISPDYLLNKCYRTDPKTLMFAHGLSMGLFEDEPLTWLEDKDWEKCGYSINKIKTQNKETYELSRVPLSRFEDIKTTENIILQTYDDGEIAESIIKIMDNIKDKYPSVVPDDIAIVFLTNSNDNFNLLKVLSKIIYQKFKWEINNAIESKKVIEEKITVSNKNNVKGLEFPFIICISRGIISTSKSYRNSLYMLLTRSFLQSYFLVDMNENIELTKNLEHHLDIINSSNKLLIEKPENYQELLEKSIYGEEEQNLTQSQKFEKAFKICNITDYDEKQRYKKGITGYYKVVTLEKILDFIDNIPNEFR